DYLYYELIDSNECRGLATTMLYITQKPLPSFTIQDSIVELGNSPVFSNTSSSENNANFLWRITGLDTMKSGDFEPNLTPDSLGYYDVSLVVTDKLRGCTDSITITKGFKVVLGTSTKEILENELEIFPNPVHDQLYLETSAFNSAQVFIYNSQGQLVLSQILNAQVESIDVSNLTKGVYLLKLNHGDKTVDMKFIKN
ncbi:MAG: T9SS type A sorting domain-containing protein, partial [Bacteroidia bacterium]